MSATTIGYQTAQYFTVGAMAAVIFDYCLTIPQEVQLIWGTKWGVIRVTFTLTRYATLMGTAMTTYSAVTDRSKYKSCAIFDDVSYTSHLMSIIAAEGLLIFRTFAFWHRNKKILVWLLVLAAFTILGAVGVSEIVKILHLADSPGNRGGCMFENGKSSAIQYVFLIIYELVLMILTLYKRFNFYKGVRGRLVSTIYCDGMIYMTCIIMVSITNIFVVLAFPHDYTAIMDALVNSLIPQVFTLTSLRPQLVIHGVLASRILFNLRQSHQSDSMIIDGMFPLANMRSTPLNAGKTTAGGSAFVSTHEDLGAKDSYE
ncbi:uncharacterized protein BJ212DRAFT_1482457 [Suillus subaureus]|uniref:DUF6533 domain-containing protein n=1 Tax=Suillus subaureus TaxID=48587 RepID=A0A9P7JBX8_9AGAM|nr:uncharacterized protein BJ212DRAFT_1482457 [Suillus subaureus]KAG1813557.1 hypothetical protein BJ212DRAFT_1482457 [Suillus subaureus]